MKLTPGIAAIALAVTLAACTTSAPAKHASKAVRSHDKLTARSDGGIVIGTFMRVGGPLGQGGTQPPPVPLMGTVIFSAGHHRMVAVRVGKTGRFSVGLPAGNYVVSGRSPSLGGQSASGALVGPPCGPLTPVTVVAGRTVHASVICPVP